MIDYNKLIGDFNAIKLYRQWIENAESKMHNLRFFQIGTGSSFKT